MVLSTMHVCNGQGIASLQIISETDATVEIQGAIDGAFQGIYTIDKFQVSPQKAIIYKTDVSDYNYLQIKIDKKRSFVWVFPDDSITIHYINGEVTFKGSNASGHRYYNNQWNGTMGFVAPLQSMVLRTDDYSDIEAKFIELFVNPAKEDINHLISADSISIQFGEVLKRDIIDYQHSELWKTLDQIQYNKKLTNSQIIQINETMSHINERFSSYDDEISLRFFLGSAYLSPKYTYLFKQLSDEKKKELYGRYTPETFGPYAHWLLAPVKVQIASFFRVIMLDNILGFTSMDTPSLINYMKEIAPQSESVAILTLLAKQRQATGMKEPIQYVEREINSLADLSETPEIKGDYCLVDIWASWCIPCRQQFQYVEELHKLTASYNNLKLVYITIDEASAEKEWKEVIENFNLTGFHLLANQKLKDDIASKVFQKKSIVIPRYLLLGPTGVITCGDMPLPNDLHAVAQILNKYLEQ